MRCSSSTTVSRPTRRASPAGTGGSVGRNLAVDGTPPRSPDQLPSPRPRRSWNASRAARPRSSGGPEAPTYVADAECRRLLTSVKTNSGTVQVRRPITLDGLTHIRCQRRVHERHRDMLDHATRDLRRVVSRAHRTRSRRSGALQVGAIPVSATCQPLQWSRSSAENSSPQRGRRTTTRVQPGATTRPRRRSLRSRPRGCRRPRALRWQPSARV